MSLLSLPNDVLIHIYKKLDRASVEKMKAANSRCRATIIRHKLDRKPAKMLTVECIIRRHLDGSFFLLWRLEAEFEHRGRTIHENRSVKISDILSKEEMAMKIRDALLELRLSSVKCLCFVNTRSHLDTNVLFQNCKISWSALTSCVQYTSNVKWDALDDNFFNKLLSKEPEYLDFVNFETGITVKTIIEHMKKIFATNRPCNWSFGVLKLTPEERELIGELSYNVCYRSLNTGRMHKVYKFLREIPEKYINNRRQTVEFAIYGSYV